MAEPGLIVTIDGPAGAGKSTLAQMLAQALGLVYLDSGALYRTLALAALEVGLAWDDQAGLADLVGRSEIELRPVEGGSLVFLNGREVTAAIRREEVGRAASAISQLEPVRRRLTELQRRLGARGGVVLEGRDAGTVVFPQAQAKFFLTASPEERARRRVAQLRAKGQAVDPARVAADLADRDEQDQSRALAPLRPAEGAVIIDSSALTPAEVVARMVDVIRSKAA